MIDKENLIKEFGIPSREGLYKAIYNRRDIRGQFINKPIPENVLSRILSAAHHAPSVGFMQPWNFILIHCPNIRKEVHNAFKTANDESANMFCEEKQQKYKSFKLEGILDAPLNICVTCDRERFGPTVIGRTTNSTMDIYSTVCAVQNLWLAARAEDLGVGWVSIFHNSDIKKILKIPTNIELVAYLCIGYVTYFPNEPELEKAGWLSRLPLENLVFSDQWGNECFSYWPKLYETIKTLKDIPKY